MRTLFRCVWMFALATLWFGYTACTDILGPGITLEPKQEGQEYVAQDPFSWPDATQETNLPETPALESSQPTERITTPESSQSSQYRYVPSSLTQVPTILQGETWLRHFQEDILPYWLSTAAKGSPEGNFPTARQMDGQVTTETQRRPRMLARQSYLYAMGYLMTGKPELLQLAQKGCQWLLTKANDTQYGGWVELLDQSGNISGTGPKWAQDTAYSLMGPAACYFITRNTSYEQVILRTRDLLFDSKQYWDAGQQRIKDGLNHQLTQEQDYDNDGGWELVAQLDQINAYMLLVQPILHSEQRRTQFLQDMQTLSQTLIKHFWQEGIFWGVHNKKGQYGSRHVDFGHTLKSYWMILQVDKRLPGNPFYQWLRTHMYRWVDLAYDPQYGGWANRMSSQTQVEYGSSWWSFAEADQLAATLNLIDYRYISQQQKTLQFWMNHYIDKTNKGIYDGVKRDGSGWGWPTSSTSKCNVWKNGYHETEHALIMYILGTQLENKPVPLYFAVPADQVNTFPATPYFYQGREISRKDLGDLGDGLRKVQVLFAEIY